jgi:hypothetical protein
MPPPSPHCRGDRPGNEATAAVSWPQAADGRPGRRPEFDVMRALVVAGLVVFHSAVVFAAGASWFVKDPRRCPVYRSRAGSVRAAATSSM